MEFSAYLLAKKINEQVFAQNDNSRYQEFKNLFQQVHPDSFTSQKLFIINQIRRKYPLTITSNEVVEEVKSKAKPAKPIIGGKAKPVTKPEVPKQESAAEAKENAEKQKPAKARPKVKPIIRKK